MLLAGTGNDTSRVPEMGHSIKQQIKNSECNIPTQVFEKNKKIQEAVNVLADLYNSNTQKSNEQEAGAKRTKAAPPPKADIPGSINEIEIFFKQQRCSNQEAHKFFYFNQARGWMINDKLPVSDWRALAQKWMCSVRGKPGKDDGYTSNYNESNTSTPADIQKETEQLYQQYLRKENVFKSIAARHFHYLNIPITEETKQQALAIRIDQLMGTNERSVNELLQAYQSSNPDPILIEKDRPQLQLLSMRLAVLHHFHQQRMPQEKYSQIQNPANLHNL